VPMHINKTSAMVPCGASMDDLNAPGPTKAGYFRVSLPVAAALVDATEDPEILAAWLVLRRYAFGKQRELTAAGAQSIAAALSISRYRAGGILRRLLRLRYGERESAFIMSAADWNAATGHKVPPMRGNACVYVMPAPVGDCAYLPDLLIPSGGGPSWLAGLCEGDNAAAELDALRLLLHLHAVISCADFIGADPGAFPWTKWSTDGDHEGFELGHAGEHRGRHYWLVAETDRNVMQWTTIKAVTGGLTETHQARFWAALKLLMERGLLYRIAIVSDARGRLRYPLWVYGESHRARLQAQGICPDLARAFQRQASRARLDAPFELMSHVLSNDIEGGSGLFLCATATPNPPIIRTVYAPTFIAPTPENMQGIQAVAALCRTWE